ncbi:bifunctional 3-(3-hydroxy-phenyl)propionate/3-hydroxycinnamic acid hydroxylase [Acinetobacter sp. MB5]|uniref:bifunctional 3-(3-hydroxy-phenyl)propionate/3-hydroxycinnamic acid hydroxylase n=1 Tax=Acinetobacter sp. MB5 TaxID=2069438 RepID=UPI000DD034D3|nr:bifunctional 3-(3-hydroxy-phenyl)propionate/3-hydroxycinnamic acid hydroxylase [Acinetobacter sp. MB5]
MAVKSGLDYDVAILGAGPVGLAIANYLGLKGIKTIVIEQLDTLINFPRAIGIDDESLRAMQSLGVIKNILPHITPEHSMRFLTPKGVIFADMQPKTYEFGWSRRNAFNQPQVDRVLCDSLGRFQNVDILFSTELLSFKQDADQVILDIQTKGKPAHQIHAKYLVACDGGNSLVRRTLNISFEGKTAPNKWIVIDIANDPLATPNVYLCCDPVRPYVSAALPHGIRRFEFMVMPGETEEELSQPENLQKLLAKVLPNPQNIELIRHRVYTHNARLAGQFRQGRILLAGDAAHIMPVWQGQGYNSGIRDAYNLAWKLSLVIQGLSHDNLLDTYEIERKKHAKAMIDLSVTAGHVLAPPKKWQGTVRDSLAYLMNYIPAAKRYFLEMRFKPMPVYEDGVVLHQKSVKKSTAGKMFIQPKVQNKRDGQVRLLDDVIGNNFAVLSWEIDPRSKMSPQTIAQWKKFGVKFIQVVPKGRLDVLPQPDDENYEIVADNEFLMRGWLGQTTDSAAVFLRPDRFVMATSVAQHVDQTSKAVFSKLFYKG